MKLLIIRHAEPDYDNDTITEKGRKQAQMLAEYLKNVKIDRIFASSCGRAQDTAKPTCAIKGMDFTILKWLEESHDFMRPFNETDNFSYNVTFRGGAEAVTGFSSEEPYCPVSRIIEGSDAFLASLGYVREGLAYRVERPNYETVAVFCHHGSGSAWISHLLLRPVELGYQDLGMTFTSITTFTFSNDSDEEQRNGLIFPYLRGLSETPHLPINTEN